MNLYSTSSRSKRTMRKYLSPSFQTWAWRNLMVFFTSGVILDEAFFEESVPPNLKPGETVMADYFFLPAPEACLAAMAWLFFWLALLVAAFFCEDFF